MDQGRHERLEGDSSQADLSKKEGVSNSTKEKVEAAKTYIERKYAKLKQEEQEKKDNWDSLQKKMEDLNIPEEERTKIKNEILHKEAQFMRMKRKKQSVRNFTPLVIIGRGAFGEVRLCRWNETGDLVAVKKMKKSEMIYKNQVTHIRAERDVLVSADIPWIVELKCSFQDEKHLYLVMEYLPGGDLMTLLMKKDILSEDEAKFYIAEAILAVDAVHKLNYIHRDLKPDNILIDSSGHIKLSDFGLCKHIGIRPKQLEMKNLDGDKPGLQLEWGRKQAYKRNRQLAFSTVGTPDYIAPEVFGQNGYTETVDWWSLGVILFEMLVGYPPFYSEDPSSTCQKILNWRKTLVIPQEANLSAAAIDLIRKLIADPNERLGINGVEEIKFHPFFFGIDWKRIREKRSGYIPELKNDIDTQHFDKFEEEEPWIDEESLANAKNKKKRKEVDFIGYTFDRNIENQRSSLVRALIDLETSKASYLRTTPNKETNLDRPQMTMSEQIVKSASLANLQEKSSFATSGFDVREKNFSPFPQETGSQIYSSTRFNEIPALQKVGAAGYIDQFQGVPANALSGKAGSNLTSSQQGLGSNYKYFPMNPQQIAMSGRDPGASANKNFSPFPAQKQGIYQSPTNFSQQPAFSPQNYSFNQQQQLYSSVQYTQSPGVEPQRASKNYPGNSPTVNSPAGITSLINDTKYFQGSGVGKKNDLPQPFEPPAKNSQLKSNNVPFNPKNLQSVDKFAVDAKSNAYTNNVTTSLTSLGVKQPFPGYGKKI